MLVGDGMADFPIPELGGKTPLEYAHTPNMDSVAARGQTGLVKTVPDGMPPGSDVANMSLLGYDPQRYYSGRAPLEAASLGVKLSPNEFAFRCNLVTLDSFGLMADYSAGHIESESAREIIQLLQQRLNSETICFYPGVSYRHLLVIRNFPEGKLKTVPPHDISGKPWRPHVPAGAGGELLIGLMHRARALLKDCAANRRRAAAGKQPATDIWLWGEGKQRAIPTLWERFKLRGAAISAVDLIRGIGTLAGLDTPSIAGATGYLGTNYAGKVAAARAALQEGNFVFVHVEAPDETSHEGSLEKKICAIEEFDAQVVGPMLEIARSESAMRIAVLPDHATPISMKTHHAAPVPYAVCGNGVVADATAAYSERAARTSSVCTGVQLFERLVTPQFSG
jgi:2,3-bisphosphoglycerate-independent phosphoglycerate mutase